MLNRRHFLVSTTAIAATISPALAGLDPTDADIKFGSTGSIYGTWKDGDMTKSKNMRMMLTDIKHYGLEGFEPYSDQAAPWYDKPAELKKLAQEIGVQIASVGDLPGAPAARPPPPGLPVRRPPIPGWAVKAKAKLISDMEACARDFLQPLGIDHWKNNMGATPAGRTQR